MRRGSDSSGRSMGMRVEAAIMPVLRPKVNIGKYKAAVLVICDRHGRSKQNSAVHLDASRRKTELSCPRFQA